MGYDGSLVGVVPYFTQIGPIDSPLPVDARDDVYAVGDFDRSGLPDIAHLELYGGVPRLSVLFNNDSNVLVKYTQGAAGNFSCMATADFNGDGHLDLVLGRPPNEVLILRGQGWRNENCFEATNHLTLSTAPDRISSGDMNHDGKLDLVLAFGNVITVYLGNGNFTFTPSTSTTIPGATRNAGSTILVEDFTQDGLPDVFVMNFDC